MRTLTVSTLIRSTVIATILIHTPLTILIARATTTMTTMAMRQTRHNTSRPPDPFPRPSLPLNSPRTTSERPIRLMWASTCAFRASRPSAPLTLAPTFVNSDLTATSTGRDPRSDTLFARCSGTLVSIRRVDGGMSSMRTIRDVRRATRTSTRSDSSVSFLVWGPHFLPIESCVPNGSDLLILPVSINSRSLVSRVQPLQVLLPQGRRNPSDTRLPLDPDCVAGPTTDR